MHRSLRLLAVTARLAFCVVATTLFGTNVGFAQGDLPWAHAEVMESADFGRFYGALSFSFLHIDLELFPSQGDTALQSLSLIRVQWPGWTSQRIDKFGFAPPPPQEGRFWAVVPRVTLIRETVESHPTGSEGDGGHRSAHSQYGFLLPGLDAGFSEDTVGVRAIFDAYSLAPADSWRATAGAHWYAAEGLALEVVAAREEWDFSFGSDPRLRGTLTTRFFKVTGRPFQGKEKYIRFGLGRAELEQRLQREGSDIRDSNAGTVGELAIGWGWPPP